MQRPNPFSQLMQLQRDLYEKAYQEARSLDLLGWGLLGKYAEEYELSLPETFSPSSLSDLILAINDCKFILYGDFHTLKQAQRGLLRLLRQLPNPRSFLLAMEMFTHNDQHLINAFMADGISDEEFMQKIEYQKKWGFPWSHYLPIIQWAKELGVEVVGINFPGSVINRDAAIAEKLKELGEKHLNKSIIVMIGEHHLADQHLPLQLAQKGIDNRKVLRIFTNVEKYFFSDCRIQTNSTDYLDLGRNRYCILNSPPWIKWQSVAVFNELRANNADDVWYDEDFEEETSDDRFHAVLHNLIDFLSISPPQGSNDFYIYRNSSSDFFEQLKILFQGRLASVFMSIAHTEGVLYPLAGRDLYLGEYTQNNIAQLAGEYLRGVSNPNSIDTKNFHNLFLRVLLSTCAGRIATKIFNPRKKDMTFLDVQEFLKVHTRKRLLGSAQKQRKSLKSLLELHNRFMVKGSLPLKESIWREDAFTNFAIARIWGNILGQDIYHSVMRGQSSKQLMIDLFCDNLDQSDLLARIYDCYREDVEKVPA